MSDQERVRMDYMERAGLPDICRFRHFKGGVYTIVCVATEEATGNTVVVYEGTNGRQWSRPAIEFFGNVSTSFPGGQGYIPRFKMIDDLISEKENCDART